jgi:phosphoglycerate dehydrogenase-like enzyme
VIINVGRGNAINEHALADALNQHALYAAFLDVAPQEPYPADGILRKTPRCYLMPHASAFAPEYLDMAFEEWISIYRDCFQNA